MGDFFPGFVDVKVRGSQHGIVRTLFQMADPAAFLGGHHQSGSHGRLGVSHHGFVHVLAACSVALFALDAVLQLKGVFALPVFGFGAGRMAPQTDWRLLRLDRDSTQTGDLLRLGLRQRGVRLGVFRQPPQALLVPHPRSLMAVRTLLVADVVRMPAVQCLCQAGRNQDAAQQPSDTNGRRAAIHRAVHCKRPFY